MESLNLKVHIEYRKLYFFSKMLILASVLISANINKRTYSLVRQCYPSLPVFGAREMCGFFYFSFYKCYIMTFSLAYSVGKAKNWFFLWISTQFEFFCSISALVVCHCHKSADIKYCIQLSYAVFLEDSMHTWGVKYIFSDIFSLNRLPNLVH